MDRRVELLRRFYGALPWDRAKVETRRHGFGYLDELLDGGATLEYGELTPTGLLHKYKLAGVPAQRMEQLLHEHVAGACNVCLYFHERSNALLCFNLDNNHKTGNTALIPEMELALDALRGFLELYGLRPLVLASGRGFHLWCRLAAPLDNERIYGLMLRLAAKTAARIHAGGLDFNKVKINLYPDKRISGAVSLRLFGTVHAKNRVFSRVVSRGETLGEEASWAAFEEHLQGGATPVEAFERAYAAVMAEF